LFSLLPQQRLPYRGDFLVFNLDLYAGQFALVLDGENTQGTSYKSECVRNNQDLE
jgi:hypothetical protein